MDNEEGDEISDPALSSSSNVLSSHENKVRNAADSYLNYDFGYPFNFAYSLKNTSSNVPDEQEKTNSNDAQINITSKHNNIDGEPNCMQCASDTGQKFAHVKLVSNAMRQVDRHKSVVRYSTQKIKYRCPII